MSGKTGNGWANGIRVSATCAALRGGGVRCAAKRNNLVTTLLTKPIYYFLLRLAVVHVLVDVELLLQIVHENHLDEGLLALPLQPLVALGEPLLV